jgi:dihydroxyacetone kinase-like predicted kinase
MTAKTDPDHFEIKTVLDVLEELGGESIVAYKQDDIVKVHVHTPYPGEVLSRMQSFGEFLTLKIENMSLGHNDEKKAESKKRNKLSVLAVASGDGMCALFSDMGADGIVSGGQTANPSTEEFIEAFKKHDAENIIVLPNNKNVFLAANQAAEMYKDAHVYIVPTKSLMQGYGALSVITPGITDMNMLVENAKRAAEGVVGYEVTSAVRNVTIGGKEIQKGDYIAISDGEINVVEKTLHDVVISIFENVDMDDYELITLFAGASVSESERDQLTEELEELYPDCEITVYEGGQDVYDYYIAIE